MHAFENTVMYTSMSLDEYIEHIRSFTSSKKTDITIISLFSLKIQKNIKDQQLWLSIFKNSTLLKI